MHRAAGFVGEHRRNAERWDLAAIARELRDTVAFHVAGSEQDPFEPRQIVAARERLGPLGVDVEWFPGGHLTTFEHPDLLADAILGLARAHGVGRHTRPTTDTGLRQTHEPHETNFRHRNAERLGVDEWGTICSAGRPGDQSVEQPQPLLVGDQTS